jgi:hypothetical protein
MSLTAWSRRLRARRVALTFLLFALASVPVSLPAATAHSQTHAQTHAIRA